MPVLFYRDDVMMAIQDLVMGLLAIALILHVIEEGWLPDYQKRKPDWRSVVLNRSLFLDNLPIFIFAILMGFMGLRWPILGGLLPAIALTHPILDHVGLSWKFRKLRPGSWTAIFLLFPLSLWLYAIAYSNHLFQLHELLISGVIGLLISIGLFWVVLQENQKAL